jgi:antitoxin HicB
MDRRELFSTERNRASWRFVMFGRFGGACMRYRVVLEQDEDGVYVAEAPALPGCISLGHTRGEALKNIKEAIAAYLESLQMHGEPVPPSISEEIVEVDG